MTKKRERIREAMARGAMPTPRKRPTKQMHHAQGPKADRHRRDGEGKVQPRPVEDA